MNAVDTNVLVRLITRDDARQTAAAELFVERGAWVPMLALAETVWVLSSVYQLKPAALAKAIEMLLHHQRLTVEDAPVAAAALEHFRSKPSLEFSDCLMLEMAKKAGHLPLGTLDRQLAKLDGTRKL